MAERELLSRTARELPGKMGVRLWLARLDVAELHDALCAVLSDDELARVAAYSGEARARRFARARGILRVLLGARMNLPPAELRFAYGRDGKPALAPGSVAGDVQFNVSHARDFALIAVAQGRQCGADLTWVERETRLGPVVARFFSAPEREVFERAVEEEQRAVFSRIWVRKEAYLKGRGEGISEWIYETDFSDVASRQSGDCSSVASRPLGERRDQDGWAFFDVEGLSAGYVASVALERLTT